MAPLLPPNDEGDRRGEESTAGLLVGTRRGQSGPRVHLEGEQSTMPGQGYPRGAPPGKWGMPPLQPASPRKRVSGHRHRRSCQGPGAQDCSSSQVLGCWWRHARPARNRTHAQPSVSQALRRQSPYASAPRP